MPKKKSKIPVIGFVLTAALVLLTIVMSLYIKPEYIEKQSDKILSSITSDKREKTFGAHSYVLDNGLQLIVIPNHRAPIVTHMVWYKVGAADEPAGKSGIAHFLEHLMFKGTQTTQTGDFSRTVRAMGGQENAFTSQDYTAYYENVTADNLSTVMKMEADRMRGLAPAAEEILSERNVILEERRQRTDNNPEAQFREHLRTVHSTNHPYTTPVIGWEHEMQQLSWDDAKSFYDQYYGPNNAIVVIAGDVQPETAYVMTQEIYGPLQPIALQQRKWTKQPPLHGSVTISLKNQKVKQPQLNLLFKVPSVAQDKETSLALDLVQTIMGQGSTSRLYKEIVIKQKLATAINMYYDSSALSHSELWISAYPAPDTSIDELKQAIITQLHLLSDNGISDDELTTAIQKAKDAAVLARDSLTGPAMIIGQSLVSGVSLDDVEYWPYDIAAITKEKIQIAALSYLNPDRSPTTKLTTGTLLPKRINSAAPNADE